MARWQSIGLVIERLQVRIPAGAAGEISSPELTLCADTYSLFVPVHPCVTAVACKRPWTFYQKCRWQVTLRHAYTLDPIKSEWADYAAVQAQCGNLSGNQLICNSSENIQPQSSQLAEPLWTDPSIKSEISVHDLIFTLKKAQAGNEWLNILPKSSQARKKSPPQRLWRPEN